MATATPVAAGTDEAAAPAAEFAALAADLDNLRDVLAIPGLSAAVVRDGEIACEQGFGFADVEHAIEADEHTPYGLASVTKPVAAIVVMQLIEEGLIGLDDPVADYEASLPGTVTVRHLLNHTSEGTPGTVHSYNGNRYGLLGGVIEGATGTSFAVHLGERVLAPLGMEDTALNPLDAWNETSIRGLESFAAASGGEPPSSTTPMCTTGWRSRTSSTPTIRSFPASTTSRTIRRSGWFPAFTTWPCSTLPSMRAGFSTMPPAP